jgi:signal transduction histidine kinase/DNA-binding response OmpR family regulator
MNTELTNTLKGDILIVDDTAENLRLLSAMLTQQGYQVRSAINGKLALTAVDAELPDLILLDINMPYMNGYEVCQHLKENPRTREIPVIFISVVDEPLDKVRAFTVGAIDFITKPFHIEEVLIRIQTQLSVRQLQVQLQRMNDQLEQQVRDRTAELRKALEFEALLKRITDQVRDSLDEDQILQTAVEVVGMGLGVECCSAGLYNQGKTTEIIAREYTASVSPSKEKMLLIANIPAAEVHQQLLQQQHQQFCVTIADPVRSTQISHAILACPMPDDQGVLGTLWLFKPKQEVFNTMEVRLVQQVANQCAIAVRQSRLYQASQTQVEELERLNSLKNDFLSSISHELRTPMANIKMAIQMLEITLFKTEPQHTADMPLDQSDAFQLILREPSFQKLNRYFHILQHECQRETDLINDLLDLSHLESTAKPLMPMTLRLQDWITHITEIFTERASSQNQSLNVVIPETVLPLTTDFSVLEQILTELLANACKYTPAGCAIALSASATSTGMELTVSNSGIELSASELAQIFEKFYRVPSQTPWKHSGIGLGLALVKKRVEHLQGSIDVANNEGWIHFTIHLPWSISCDRSA